MGAGGPLGSRMPPSASMMMAGSNPYGPSGPPPPSLSGTPFSATSGGMSGPPGGRLSSMYSGGTPVGPGSASGGPGMPLSGAGGGASQQHSHPPPPSVIGAGGTPKPPSVLNTVQLQQLSAQLKAYKLLARSVSPPEALISIVHGRKPTPAMLAALGKQTHQQSSHQSVNSMGAPPQGDAQRGPGSGTSSEGGSGGNISLYPTSPNVSQGAYPVSTSQSQPPVRSTSSLAQPLSSSTTAAAGGAPNITISSSGELPLSVKQAISAAQTRSSNTPPSGQQSATPPTSSSPAPNAQGPPPSTPGQNVPTGQSQTTPVQQQQQQQMKAQLKSMKLAPSGKPQGIDPTVIIKEREHRYVCLFVFFQKHSKQHCVYV